VTRSLAYVAVSVQVASGLVVIVTEFWFAFSGMLYLVVLFWTGPVASELEQDALAPSGKEKVPALRQTRLILILVVPWGA
jgi:hypothetical protein